LKFQKNSDFANQLKSDNFKIDEQQCSQCSADPAIDIIKTTQGGDDTFTFTLQEKSPPKSQSFTISTQSGSGTYSFPDLPQGTYTITEDLTGMDGWESQGVQCTIQNSSNLTVTSPTNSITIELLFGDKATCEFKNIKLPTLIVAKKTIGGYGDFDFTVTNGTDSSQNVVTYGTQVSTSSSYNPANDGGNFVTIGSHTVTETPQTGWENVSTECSINNGEPQAGSTVDLKAGEVATCTFTNHKLPTLQLAKQTVGGFGKFDFTVTNGTGSFATSIETSDGTNPADGDVAIVKNEKHTISESMQSGWEFVEASCTVTHADQTMTTLGPFTNNPFDITLDNGDVAKCTVKNQKLPTLQISKNTIGGFGKFDFTVTNGTGSFTTSVTTSNGTNPADGDVNIVTIGSHTVTETPQAGWEKVSTECSINNGEPQAGSTVDLKAGDVAKCTVKNQKLPTLQISKNTIGGFGKFDFTVTNGTGSFTTSVTTSNGTNPADGDVNIVTIGSHTVTEQSKAGWSFVQTVCDVTSGDKTTSTTYTTNPSSLTLGAGDVAKCTVKNTLMPILKLTKISHNGVGTFGFTITNGTGPLIQSSITTTVPNQGTSSGSYIVTTGDHTITESSQNGWAFGSAVCTVVHSDKSTTSLGPFTSSPFTITLVSGDNVECVVNDNGATRSQGFWATHSDQAKYFWDTTNANVCGKDANTYPIMEGGFWSSIPKLSDGKTSRTSLDQARMQLVQQLIAAKLNVKAFGLTLDNPNLISDANNICKTGTPSQIIAQVGILDQFNTSGDKASWSPSYQQGTGGYKGDTADKKFWDKFG